MTSFRFEVGAVVLCNMGLSGWKLGRIIALRYREEHWPAGQYAPYQVALEADHQLIYVPEDDPRYCREATREDLRIARRMDALAALPPGLEGAEAGGRGEQLVAGVQLSCAGGEARPGRPTYRSGRCHCCDCCPRGWSAVELYSEHYRCALRNGLHVTQRAVDLGTVRVGDVLRSPAGGAPTTSSGGFMQCPTLARLPPGVRFSDDGALSGVVRFDPYRAASYRVEFVAVSTVDWEDAKVGVVRLEITFVVEGNDIPDEFDAEAFAQEQQQARDAATRMLHDLYDAWEKWESGALDHRDTIDQMCAELHHLRELLEQHPRLDGGRWWAVLGGFYMNVHKLLENTLFECELYLGHALTFGDPEVRRQAEQNLDGCYQKRQLEAARFMWLDGVERMTRGEWASAAETLSLAAAKKDGWGWAVNYGDIWMSESAARLMHGAELLALGGSQQRQGAQWVAEAARVLEKAVERSGEEFGAEGHPWVAELVEAFSTYRNLRRSGTDTADWLEAFKHRTVYWCALALGGMAPFPPKLRPRREDAAALVQRMPGHHA
ncbi:MAG: hypothetical protein AAGI01_11415 [Myxococcota bacterium]